MVPGTGVCLNNFLYWADVTPNSPNRAKPGDAAADLHGALASSTADGKPVLALGTPGSYGILQTQAQAMVQYVDFGLPLQEAIEAPRARLWDGRPSRSRTASRPRPSPRCASAATTSRPIRTGR